MALKEIAQRTCEHPVSTDENATPKALIIHAEDLVPLCQEFYKNKQTYFDSLSCITGIDNGTEASTMEVIYNLYSIPFNHHLMIKAILSRENPEIESLYSIWKGADWLEREVYDMFGIVFKNHPDFRRILMPADWEGFPLRKDYQHQEKYRGVNVAY